MPLNVLPKPGPTKKQLEKEMLEEMRLPMEYNTRQRGTKETAEARKERKHAVKTERKVGLELIAVWLFRLGTVSLF